MPKETHYDHYQDFLVIQQTELARPNSPRSIEIFLAIFTISDHLHSFDMSFPIFKRYTEQTTKKS